MKTAAQAISDLQSGYVQMIDTVGTDFTLTHLDDTTQTIKAHIVPAGKEDTAIVNSVGIDAIFLHCHAAPVIKKNEMITSPSGREYSVEASHEVYVKNILVGQKVIAR